MSRNSGFDVLDFCGFRADRIVERKRPVKQRTGDLFAIGHFAQRRCFDLPRRDSRSLRG